MKKEIAIKEYKAGRITGKTDRVAQEKPVRLVINGKGTLSVSMSPWDLQAFTYGYLLTSGLMTAKEEITGLNIRNLTVEVRLENDIITDEKAVNRVTVTLPSGCGGGSMFDLDRHKQPFAEKIMPVFDNLPSLFTAFHRESTVFEETGGVHSAAISDGTSVLFFSEDIGRHNAVDKVIGKALLADVDINSQPYFLLTTGRISGEIVKKAFYGGLRTIVSRSAPTCMALKRAEDANIGIIGFLRGKRFNIY